MVQAISRLLYISIVATAFHATESIAQISDTDALGAIRTDTIREADGSYRIRAHFADRIEITEHWETGQVKARSVAPVTTPSGSEPTALAAAAALQEVQGDLATIWPGYWDSNHAFAIYPVSGGTMVIWPQAQEGPAPSFNIPELPSVLGGRAYLMDGASDLPFVLDYSAGGRTIAAVSIIPPFSESRTNVAAAPWMADSVLSVVSFAAHEGFHTYQRLAFAPIAGSIGNSPAANFTLDNAFETFFSTAESRTALEAERVALQVALNADSAEQSLAAIRSYLELKDDRLRGAPRGLGEFEDAHERMEGIANWVGYHAVRVVLGQPIAATVLHLASDLEDGVPEPMRYGWQGFTQWHLYVTGAAKTELLRRLSTDQWQRNIEKGATLDQELRRL